MTERIVQSANIPIHTAIGPKWKALTRNIQSATRQHHMVIVDVIMENLTSPAALSPYAITKEQVHTSGFAIVIAVTISKHISALTCSIPASQVTGLVIASTSIQDTIIPISAIPVSFTI